MQFIRVAVNGINFEVAIMGLRRPAGALPGRASGARLLVAAPDGAAREARISRVGPEPARLWRHWLSAKGLRLKIRTLVADVAVLIQTAQPRETLLRELEW